MFHMFSRALSSGLAFGAAAFVLILLLIQVAGIAGRLAGITVQAADAYAGYCLAAASFLALGAGLYRADHIRVTLLLQRLSPGVRYRVELACLAVGTVLTGYFLWFAIGLVRGSWEFGDVSPNIDATPLWIPQLAMALGLFGLFLAFIDHLLRTWSAKTVLTVDEAERVALE